MAHTHRQQHCRSDSAALPTIVSLSRGHHQLPRNTLGIINANPLEHLGDLAFDRVQVDILFAVGMHGDTQHACECIGHVGYTPTFHEAIKCTTQSQH